MAQTLLLAALLHMAAVAAVLLRREPLDEMVDRVVVLDMTQIRLGKRPIHLPAIWAAVVYLIKTPLVPEGRVFGTMAAAAAARWQVAAAVP